MTNHTCKFGRLATDWWTLLPSGMFQFPRRCWKLGLADWCLCLAVSWQKWPKTCCDRTGMCTRWWLFVCWGILRPYLSESSPTCVWCIPVEPLGSWHIHALRYTGHPTSEWNKSPGSLWVLRSDSTDQVWPKSEWQRVGHPGRTLTTESSVGGGAMESLSIRSHSWR